MIPDLDLLVVGGGVAGLTAALRADRAGLRVAVLTKAALGRSTTEWAQGGVAAVLSPDDDSVEDHLSDTLRAGAGLCDVAAVRVLVEDGPDRVRELLAGGARFDREPDGSLSLAREGGHGRARILHTGTATGREIERALVEAVRERGVPCLEHWFATGLLVEAGRCAGLEALDPNGAAQRLRAAHVLLASGGAGQLYAVTTSPVDATGDGIALALRAGVAVVDLEFVQFHPTALHCEQSPRPLLSEALRGHGAVVLDAAGARFVDELAPRDVVSRSMTHRMLEQGVDHLWLDARSLERFAERFPNIAHALARLGLDASRDLLPVAPAAHYTCGGVLTDLDGASTLPGCWAAGEVAGSGVHGANRLASNSLLDGLVFGTRAVDAVLAGRTGPEPTGAMAGLLDPGRSGLPVDELPVPPVMRSAEGASVHAALVRRELQRSMNRDVGMLRTDASLARAAAGLVAPTGLGRAEREVAHLTLVATALVAAARRRTETRGAHVRADHPVPEEGWRRRLAPRLQSLPERHRADVPSGT